METKECCTSNLKSDGLSTDNDSRQNETAHQHRCDADKPQMTNCRWYRPLRKTMMPSPWDGEQADRGNDENPTKDSEGVREEHGWGSKQERATDGQTNQELNVVSKPGAGKGQEKESRLARSDERGKPEADKVQPSEHNDARGEDSCHCGDLSIKTRFGGRAGCSSRLVYLAIRRSAVG